MMLQTASIVLGSIQMSLKRVFNCAIEVINKLSQRADQIMDIVLVLTTHSSSLFSFV
jgi:hypothetical protein